MWSKKFAKSKLKVNDIEGDSNVICVDIKYTWNDGSISIEISIEKQ